MLRRRVITGLWGVPLVIVAIWFGEPVSWFTVLAVIVGLLAIIEFYKITGINRVVSLTVFGLIWTIFFIIEPHWNYEHAMVALLTSAVVISLLLRVPIRTVKFSLTDWIWALSGIIYLGLLLGLLVSLRINAGREWLYLVILCTFASDTAAFFIGRAVGRHKLAPNISPGKTWEGAVGGLFGAVIISLLFTLSTPVQLPIGYGEAIILGVIISIFGQIGDLAESKLKRHKGIKESGTLMPGHGGLLDRLDSILFAGLAVYIYYTLVVI
jgi:phosphatidate cytidylyltransferase